MSKQKTVRIKATTYMEKLDTFIERNFEQCEAVCQGNGNPEIAKVVSQGLRGHVAAGNFALKAQKMGSPQTLLGLPSPKPVETK